MATRRQKRIGDAIQKEISQLLERELQDPRLRSVTITGVQISPDLRHARVWYSVLGEDDDLQAASEALHHAVGFFRREVGERLRLRYVPELTFHVDDTWQKGSRIDALLQQIALEKGDDERPTES